MSLEITPMHASHIVEAASLSAMSFKALRRRIPLLPERYEQPEVIRGMLEDLGDRLSGAVAFDGSEMVGFCAGFYMKEFLGKRAFYSPEWANAAHPAGARRIYESLYAELAPEWLASKAVLHLISLPAYDNELIDAFNWLGFGKTAVDGLRSLDPIPGKQSNVTIRKAGADDAHLLDEIEKKLIDHIAGPPAFIRLDSEDMSQLVQDPHNQFWLAFQDGKPVGLMGLEDNYTGGCALLQDEATVQLEPAYVAPEARGTGTAQALLNRCLAEARLAGYQRCSVDFEASNLHAQRFWLRYFTPVYFTLLRWVDERLAG